MYKNITALALIGCLMFAGVAEAKGGFSSGGGSRGGFSSRSSSSFSSSRPSSGSASSSNRSSSYSSASRPSSSSVSRTTTRSYTSRSYSGNYIHGSSYYGGFGMGYMYNNGFMTGLILGNMMHPYGTVMYGGPGMYANNALLYPNGQVVSPEGVLVGNYANNQFSPVENGGVVAQSIPNDVHETQQAQPVVIVQQTSVWSYIGAVALAFVIFIVLCALFM